MRYTVMLEIFLRTSNVADLINTENYNGNALGYPVKGFTNLIWMLHVAKLVMV